MIYAGLLGSVNVGGTGKLLMSDFKAICASVGLHDVTTYIASGNVIFSSDEPEEVIKKELKEALLAHMGKEVSVFIRTQPEMEEILKSSPFSKYEAKYTLVTFFNDTLDNKNDYVTKQADEKYEVFTREIYVYYPSGIGKSKLKIKSPEQGTARNINTISKIIDIMSGLKEV